MFEKDIKFISDFTLNKIKKLGSFFTFEKLASTDVHPAVIRYISSELEYLIIADRKRLLQQSVFDYSGAEISKYFTSIGEEIKRTKRLSYEDVKKLVIHAVSFTTNYLVRPKWSLTKLIFEGSEIKPAEEVGLMLNYTYYYDYLLNIIRSYLEKKKPLSMTVKEFEVLASKIDKELFTPQPEKMLDNALHSIADFFNIGAVSSSKISPVAVETFLREKKLNEYIYRLRKAVPMDSKLNLGISELKSILLTEVPIEPEAPLSGAGQGELFSGEDRSIFDRRIEKSSDEKKQTEDEAAHDESSYVQKTFLGLGETIKFKVREEDEDEDISEETAEEIISDELDSTADQDISKPEKAEQTETDDFDISDLEDRDEMKEIEEKVTEITHAETEEVIEKNDTAGIETLYYHSDGKNFHDDENNQPDESDIIDKKVFEKDIFSYMSNKEIEKIVGSVFNDDQEDFANTMEKIAECTSYEEATEILKAVFLSYRINPYSKEAVSLTNAAASYFNQI